MALIKERFIAPPIGTAHFTQVDRCTCQPRMMAAARETLLWFTRVSFEGTMCIKKVWKSKIGLGSTVRAMHDQYAVNSASMRLTSIKPGKYVCAYENVCAYKKGAPNNPSLRVFTILKVRNYDNLHAKYLMQSMARPGSHISVKLTQQTWILRSCD